MLLAGCPKLCSIHPSFQVEGTASNREIGTLGADEKALWGNHRMPAKPSAWEWACVISTHSYLVQASLMSEGLEIQSSSREELNKSNRYFWEIVQFELQFCQILSVKMWGNNSLGFSVYIFKQHSLISSLLFLGTLKTTHPSTLLVEWDNMTIPGQWNKQKWQVSCSE